MVGSHQPRTGHSAALRRAGPGGAGERRLQSEDKGGAGDDLRGLKVLPGEHKAGGRGRDPDEAAELLHLQQALHDGRREAASRVDRPHLRRPLHQGEGVTLRQIRKVLLMDQLLMSNINDHGF